MEKWKMSMEKTDNGKMLVFSTNGAQKTRYSHTKE